jgi:regulator of RNase E activity RraA
MAITDRDVVATLSGVTTATLTTLLLKKGLRNVWMRGTRPLNPGQPRLVGRAFTLRFVPAREDLATPESWSKPISTRGAIEAMPEGCICVADAMGVTDAGIFGDILCARMKKRGVAALVTDGVVRDAAGVRSTGLPVWCQGAAAPAVGRGPHVRQLERAHRLRRRGGVPGRLGRGRRRRRGAHSRRADRGSLRHRPRAGATRGLDHVRGRQGRFAPGLYPRTPRTRRATKRARRNRR